ncbi:MAG: hypothetical protein IJV80_06140 [Clostridia bacterium]|nr:hypothetical protein [Clostridia bacterium]
MAEEQPVENIAKEETDLNDVFEPVDFPAQKEQEKSDLPAPRPENPTMPAPKKRKTGKIVLSVLGGVLIAASSFFAGMLVHKSTLDDDLLTIAKLKNTIQKYYYQEISDDEFYSVLYRAVNDGLLDDYSHYLPAEELAKEMKESQGGYVGFGLTFYTTAVTPDKGLYIARVSGNSPAERAGIRSRSYLTGYGETEQSIEPFTTYEKFSQFCENAAVGKEVVLEVKDGESAPKRTVKVARGEYVENYVYYRAATTAYSFAGETAEELTPLSNEYYLPIAQDTAYIELTSFNGGAAEQFGVAMEQFRVEGKKNLVLDLRSNGGGYMDILCGIASYFCKSGKGMNPTVAIAKYRDGREERFTAHRNDYGEYFATDSRICVLADQNTASASECLIGAMIDYGACAYADVCLTDSGNGGKTFGKGIMQSTYYLTLVGEKDAVTLTSATVHWPVSKNCIHGRGVLVADGTKTVAYSIEGDQELLAALAALGLNA